jgi:hypothetical protein
VGRESKAKRKLRIYFSDFFDVDPDLISNYGAFNISLINDLPLFIDPFLLFDSEKAEYKQLHADMIKYVRFLKSQSSQALPPGLIKGWFHFPEIKENWLGFSEKGNGGRGLGPQFAKALKVNLTTVFKDFGDESTSGTHLEKLTLVKDGVGRDQISDLTCNLICGYLADYTETFAKEHIAANKLAKFNVERVSFSDKTQTWTSKQFVLPKFGDQFVLLTPIDMLTKDESWITHKGFVEDFSAIRASVANDQLRAQIDNYFVNTLPIEPSKEEITKTVEQVALKYPQLFDIYLARKEKDGAGARAVSGEKLDEAYALYVHQLQQLADLLLEKTKFYEQGWNSQSEALARVGFLKEVIENEDGYQLFYLKGQPIKREKDLQIMFKLTWFASPYDANAEVNNGRGPADFVISHGSADKTVLEFKLASNTQLEKNLKAQAEIYSKASRAKSPPIKAILYFSTQELEKVQGVLRKLDLDKKKEIVLIDARDKKVSASKA